jgi:predicted O-methyltransferase YrrM
MGNKLEMVGRYIAYLFRSTNRHGLQSTFVFNLNETVFRRDKNEERYNAIEKLRAELLHDHRKINVRDFGAGFGGKVYKELSVDFITRNSSKPPKYARMLSRLVAHLQPKTILELGTSVGISALYQSAGNADATIITLEGCTETAKLARASFAKFPQAKIKVVEGMFVDTLPEVLKEIEQLDYVFIDGHHQLRPTLTYFEICLPKLSENAVVVIDDINWSDEMREAWEQLKKHPRVPISIDVFMMGILFVNPGFSKEDFVIRY